MATRFATKVALTVALAGSLLFAAAAQAATPLYVCMSSMIYLSDRAGQLPPREHELIVTPTDLPDYIPQLTSKSGYDYCVHYARMPFDGTAAPFDSGTVSAVVYKLNERGKWRRLVRVAGTPVEDNEALACRNSKKSLEPGDTLRWVIRLNDLPPLGYLDLHGFDTMIVTGGAGEAMAGG